MYVKSNRSLYAIVSMLLVTSFVTACVKNESKDESPKQIALKQMDITTLSDDNLDGSKLVILQEQSSVAAHKITKDYIFKIDDIRELRVAQAEIINKDCSAQESFIYSFYLVGENNYEKPLNTIHKKELLTPGSHRLRVKIENGSLCKMVSMKFKIKTTVRDDLILTKNLDAGYQCYDVEENGIAKVNTSVRINTAPMKVLKYFGNNLGKTRESIIVDQNTLCQREVESTLNCSEKIIPATKDERPLMATQKRCQKENQIRKGSQATLQVNKRGALKTAKFTCNHKRKVLRYNLSRCEIVYMMGEELPLVAKQTDIAIRPRNLRMNFSIDETQLDLASIPNRLFVSVVTRTLDDYYEPVLSNFYEISREDLADGYISIREPNLKFKLANAELDSLKLIIAKRPNLRSGLFKISIDKLCNDDSGSIVEKRPHSSVNLCE